MKKRTLLLSTSTILVMIALTACGSITVPSFAPQAQPAPAMPQAQATQVAPTPQVSVPASGSDGLLAAYQGTLENIYSSGIPSVVNIHVVSKSDSSNSNLPQIPGFPFFNLPQDQIPQPQYQAALSS